MSDYGMLDPVRGLGKGLAICAGTFFPDTAAAPTTTAGSGGSVGWTVARTSAGLFTITFSKKFACCLFKTAHLQLAAGDDKIVQVGTYSASAGTCTVRVWDVSGAAETDVAANANNAVNFLFIFSTHASPK